MKQFNDHFKYWELRCCFIILFFTCTILLNENYGIQLIYTVITLYNKRPATKRWNDQNDGLTNHYDMHWLPWDRHSTQDLEEQLLLLRTPGRTPGRWAGTQLWSSPPCPRLFLLTPCCLLWIPTGCAGLTELTPEAGRCVHGCCRTETYSTTSLLLSLDPALTGSPGKVSALAP